MSFSEACRQGFSLGTSSLPSFMKLVVRGFLWVLFPFFSMCGAGIAQLVVLGLAVHRFSSGDIFR